MARQFWLFQGNPTVYRVREAVAALPRLKWAVKQHRDLMQPGDTVYLWESGPHGGLVGRATIETAVGLHEDLPEELPFWKQPPTTEDKTPSVLLKIDAAFSVVLQRKELMSESELAGMRLFKMPQGTNYPLTPAEAAQLERLTSAQPTFAEVMRRYHDEQVVFPSIERGALYWVRQIDETGCELARLSADEPVRVTWSLHEKRLEELRRSGGSIVTAELDGTAAVRAAFVQSPLLGLSADRERVTVLETENAAVELFCDLIASLKVDRHQGEPKLYKAAMLAALLESIGSAEIRDHRIPFGVLLPLFLAKLAELGRTAGPEQGALAFFHLTGDLFWHLAYVDVERRLDTEHVSPTAIRERVRYAVLKEPFGRILRNEAHRTQVMKKLAEVWWPPRERTMTQRRFWWVNQGASFEQERANGTIWCPQVDKGGNTPSHWKNVSLVRKGDFIFHFAKQEVRSVSLATSDAAEGNKPREIAIGDEWNQPGWYASVEYRDLDLPIVQKSLQEILRRLEIPGGPFNKHGGVNQGYLFALNDRAVCLLEGELTETQLPTPFASALLEARKRVWDAFLHWGRRFLETADIREAERTSKLAGSANVASARTAFTGGDSAWLDVMKRAFTKNNWATDYRTHDDLLKWWNDHPDEARRAAESIWDRSSDMAACMARFWEHVPREVVSGNGTQAAVASFLFGEREPERFPLFRSEPYQAAYALTGCWRKTLTAGETYQWALDFLDRIITEAASRGITLADRLDAQTLLWCVVKHEPPAEWSQEEKGALEDYRAGKEIVSDDARPKGHDAMDELANRLLIPRKSIEETKRLLEIKNQVIFYGPPGTGKTYVARELARHFAGSPDNVEIVQFHPSYAYEDFVEGFRPRGKGDQVGFELVRGPLRRLARRAAQDPSGKYVLLIDEINRGNIAKVFGELYFLLEYRNEKIRLQYDHRRRFSLPENLWIIGTMNTADRSIALMDAALRRRFFFLPFFPDEPPIAGLLERWLQRHRPAMVGLAGIVDRANKLLGERHGAIGPSHFMRTDLDDALLALIWKHAVMPYLAEQFFGEEERLKVFELAALQAAASSSPSPQV